MKNPFTALPPKLTAMPEQVHQHVGIELFEVSSPPSVIGNFGQDAVLPCQISLQTQPKNMEVKWEIIGDKSIDNIYQFTAVTGQETFGPGYLGRVGLVKEGVATGNVSLKLKKVQINDEGTYRCVVKSSDWIAQTQTVIHVAALGNVSIEVLGPEGEGMKLSCVSVGWFPEPELRWLAKKSQNLQFKSKQDHEQLFSVWSNITVLRDTGKITCSVHERSHLQRTQESTILLSRDIFPDTFPWLSAFCGLLTVAITLSVGVGVAVYCRCKEKQKESKRKQDEEEKRTLLGRPCKIKKAKEV
ncbi:hypothetical protein lerEdw1_004204 [Lerista edwardsae]|nr:hypothetical protein lerEdw1_004206 [Lerista edwardsae]KAJ6650735.1 hypothetical protein lerEdw1_004204 [Lerista edwardsae]